MTTTVEQVRKARAVGVPIIAITTPDARATIGSILVDDDVRATIESTDDRGPAYGWDMVDGLTELNPAATQATEWRTDLDQMATIGEVGIIEVLNAARKSAGGGIYFVLNAHRVLVPESGQGVNGAVSQAIGNVRDDFKSTGQTLVLLAPDLDLPPELQGDVLVIDEELPGRAELEDIVRQVHEAVGTSCSYTILSDAVDATLGLPAFAAEQAMFLSMRKGGLDISRLWERKRQMVEATPGLSVYRGDETYDGLRGVDNIVDYMRLIFGGNNKPKAVVFLDEIEKAMAGATGGESSGTSADQLGELLKYMEDHQARGLLFVGPPGAAKSAVAKAAGNDAGVPTVEMDLGAAKGSLVGQSEAQVRAMLKVVTAVSDGAPLFIATSNDIAKLPPELKRRFTMGTFYFDLPTTEERAAIWDVYTGKYGVEVGLDDLPTSVAAEQGFDSHFDDDGWTGAEIKACARNAADLGISLDRAAGYIVPVAKSDADRIERLRVEANGRYISASVGGPYERQSGASAPKTAAARQVRKRLED